MGDGHPVGAAMTYLKDVRKHAGWLAPSELLDRLVRDRRMLESAVDGPRTRDVWRRLRFVVDHARAWTEAGGGTLREYLSWAHRQGMSRPGWPRRCCLRRTATPYG